MFHARHAGQGTALDLVKMVTETFPSFRDETVFEGRRGTWDLESLERASSCGVAFLCPALSLLLCLDS